MARDARFRIGRHGAIICPECTRVVVLAGANRVIDGLTQRVQYCGCGWAQREYPGDDNEYKRLFEIIWAGDDE